MNGGQAFGRVLSTEPLVTISKRALGLRQPMGFAGLIENLDRAGPSLHLVGLMFSMEPHGLPPGWNGAEPDTLSALALDYDEVSRRNPHATFVILANTDGEVFELSRLGIPCILANELIFTDERVFDVTESNGPAEFSAVYNAGLIKFKRHWLASEIDDLVLIFKNVDERALERVTKMLPQAKYANMTIFQDKYRWNEMSHQQVAKFYARCGVGLCLSMVEGPMRASMEYLLCGLPVVTTPSFGGRARYFRSAYAVVSNPDPQDVAEAVREAASLRSGRPHIRRAVLDLLEFDRTAFLLALNGLLRSELRAQLRFESIDPFRSSPIHSAPLESFMFSWR